MPNTREPQLSLKTIVDTISTLETHYGSFSGTDIDPVRQKATLKFLASLKELVRAFCLQGGGDDEGELGYLQSFGLRGK